MKLLTIELEGFKSFQEYQSFSFDLDNGLYFVTGENKVETNLGANGAGKSALFEAICWGLYGKTSTNLKAGNIVSWGSKRTWVKLEFDNEDSIYRGQSPNILKLNDNPVTQDELEKHLGGLGFESFLYSTFISQFSSKFFDLSPADKMIVFSDIMAETLQPWLNRSDKAKVKANNVNEEIRKMESAIAGLNGRLSQLESQDYSQQAKGFEEDKKERLAKYNTELIHLEDNEKLFKVDLRTAMQDKIKFQMDLNQFKPTISIKEYDSLKDKREKTRDLCSAYKADYKSLENDLEKMTGTLKKGEGVCPTCKQVVDKKHLKAEIDSCKKQMSSAEFNYNTYVNGVSKISEEINKVEKRIEADKHKQIDMEFKIKVSQSKIESITQNLERIKKEIEKVNSDINYTKGTKNQYAQMEKERQADLKKFKAAVKDNEDLLGVAKKEFDAYQYWVKGFKEIRLLLMVDALKEFEISINNNLSKFGMGDWYVKLDIDQENKSGTIRKGFAVLVESPGHNSFVPFEVWSGGEGQRLRLAGTVGLMDLIQSKRQIDFGLEIFDEPTAWLSDKGIDDLVQALYYRAKENEKKIFLIDHKNLGSFGGFHGTINIVKDEKGSRVV